MIAILTSTNPAVRSVAPFGGLTPVTTSNPIAFGIPTEEQPILADLCTSVVSNGAIAQHRVAGTPLPDNWVNCAVSAMLLIERRNASLQVNGLEGCL